MQGCVDIITGNHDALDAWELETPYPSGPSGRLLRQATNDVINYPGRGLGGNNAGIITFSYGKKTVETEAQFKVRVLGLRERVSEWMGVRGLWYL